MIIIKLSVKSSKEEILLFLNELASILNDANFKIENDLTIIRSSKKQGKEKYSTIYTLLDLDYDAEDIAERLKELTIEEYSETLIDKDDFNPPLLFVFGKDINSRQIYIKVKIKGEEKKRILCVSFHYAERKMYFPYA